MVGVAENWSRILGIPKCLVFQTPVPGGFSTAYGNKPNSVKLLT